VVNILAEVIADLLKQGLAALLAPGGRLILSGIIEEPCYARWLTIIERLEEGDWLALLAERLPDP